MLSPRRSRAFVFIPALSCLIIWYNYGSSGRFFEFGANEFHPPQPPLIDDGKKHAIIETSVSLKASQILSSRPRSSISASRDPWGHPTLSTSIVEPTQTASTTSNTPDLVISPSDVLLIIKTGASTIWRRMPLHLTTTLADGRVPNRAVYSDSSEKLAGNIESIDTLANVSDLIRGFDPAAYHSYIDFQSPSHINTYRERAQLPGDEPEDPKADDTPGWLLDKYKFLPMLSHAQRVWPALRWYIYIEDDSFIFWDNILKWLSSMSPDDEPSYYGALSGYGNETFAQGGSGLVFSRSLMRTVFGGDHPPDFSRYGNYTSNSCCGDMVLGKVLRDYNIYVNKGRHDLVSFRPEPPWKTGFNELIWCLPVFTFHHLHQRDLIQLAELERTQKVSSTPSRPVIFRDVFNSLILPHLINDTRYDWDNFASRYTLTANSTTGFHPDFRPVNSTAFNMAFKSSANCRAACLSFDECLSWRHDSGAAIFALDSVINLGRELDPLASWAPKSEVFSGWMLERMDSRLLAEKCNIVKQP